MAQKIASLYAEITADSSRAEAAIANTKTALAGLGNSFGDTALKQQLLQQRTTAYRNSMKDLASQVMTGKMTMEDASKAASRLATEMGLGEQTAKRSRLTYMDLASKVFLAQQAFNAVSGVAKQTWQIIGEGAQLELATSRFDRLSESIGTTSDAILDKYAQATAGMVSNADMIANASQIISLGLATNEKDTVRLANVVSQLGLDMNQVILTFANDSVRRLDSLGLSISDVEARTKSYKEAGIEASKAFDMAVLDALEARLTLLGSAAGTTAGSMARLTASWENLTNAGKQFMAVRMEGPISGLANTIDAVGEASDKGHSPARNFAVVLNEINKSMGGDANAGDVLIDKLWGAEEAMVAAAAAASVYDQNLIRHSQTAEEAAKAIVFTADALGNYASLESTYARQGEASSQSAVNSWRARQEAIEAYGRSLNEGLGLEAQYAGAAQLATTQTNNAALKAAFYAEQQALAAQATAELTDRLSDSFVSFSQNEEALANYTTMMQGVATVSHEVGGRTAEQNAELDRLQGIYDKAAGTIRDYEQGLKGVNLSDEARNEKIAEQNQLMLNAQAAMAPLLGINSEYATSTDGGAAATAALNQALYDQIAAVTEDQTVLALAGVELGIFSQAQADAMLKAALLEEEIRRQAAAWDGTASGLEQMQVQLGNYIGMLNSMPSVVETEVRTNYTSTGTPNASGAGATVPGVPQARAMGGPVMGGHSYMVGERGPELLTMPAGTSGHITPNNQLGGAPTVNVYIYGGGAGAQRTANVVANRVVEAIGRLS